MSRIRIMLASLAAVVVCAGSANAQAFGVQASFADDFDFGVGARLEANLGHTLSSTGPLSRALFIGSFDVFFPDSDVDYWEANANVAFPVSTGSLRPYLGTGLNVGHVSVASASSTDLGLNLLGGIHVGTGRLQPYLEGRFELGGGEQAVLTFGIMLGGNR